MTDICAFNRIDYITIKTGYSENLYDFLVSELGFSKHKFKNNKIVKVTNSQKNKINHKFFDLDPIFIYDKIYNDVYVSPKIKIMNYRSDINDMINENMASEFVFKNPHLNLDLNMNKYIETLKELKYCNIREINGIYIKINNGTDLFIYHIDLDTEAG
jgi:hypothetical protein